MPETIRRGGAAADFGVRGQSVDADAGFALSVMQAT